MTQHAVRRSAPIRLLVAGAALIALAGCDQTDPYQRVGVWRPMGANDLNLELQVARPSDLVMGRGTDVADGATAAAAIDRLRTDKVKPLPEIGISKIGGGNGQGGGK